MGLLQKKEIDRAGTFSEKKIDGMGTFSERKLMGGGDFSGKKMRATPEFPTLDLLILIDYSIQVCTMYLLMQGVGNSGVRPKNDGMETFLD